MTKKKYLDSPLPKQTPISFDPTPSYSELLSPPLLAILVNANTLIKKGLVQALNQTNNQ